MQGIPRADRLREVGRELRAQLGDVSGRRRGFRRTELFGLLPRCFCFRELLFERVAGLNGLRQPGVRRGLTIGEVRGRRRQLRRMPLLHLLPRRLRLRQFRFERVARRDFLSEQRFDLCQAPRLLCRSATLGRGALLRFMKRGLGVGQQAFERALGGVCFRERGAELCFPLGELLGGGSLGRFFPLRAIERRAGVAQLLLQGIACANDFREARFELRLPLRELVARGGRLERTELPRALQRLFDFRELLFQRRSCLSRFRQAGVVSGLKRGELCAALRLRREPLLRLVSRRVRFGEFCLKGLPVCALVLERRLKAGFALAKAFNGRVEVPLGFAGGRLCVADGLLQARSAGGCPYPALGLFLALRRLSEQAIQLEEQRAEGVRRLRDVVRRTELERGDGRLLVPLDDQDDRHVHATRGGILQNRKRIHAGMLVLDEEDVEGKREVLGGEL